MNCTVFDRLYVVSDLHLGGRPGFQIFCQGATLANTIRALAGAAPDQRTGLVLNGDIVDFLAEHPPKYLDPKGAIAKLKRIFAEDPGDDQPDLAFAEVWKALKEFVATPKRDLVLVLGNHDVELALPPVVEWIKDSLSRGDPAARGQITFCVDGAGFPCEVGGKRVLCVHGNEADIWNVVDYRQLLEVSRALNRGTELPAWDANAGTRMVIDIMNEIKRDFPMVDLLKPEMQAAVPMVLALDPSRVKEIVKLLKVVGHLGADRLRQEMGFLSAEQELAKEGAAAESDEQVLGRFLADHFGYDQTAQMQADDLVNQAFDEIERGVEGGGDTNEGFLGPFDYVRAFFAREGDKADHLRKALKDKLAGDRTFDVAHEDKVFQALDKEIGDSVDYLITGHTHLERALERSGRGRYYFNSGTWIRLIHLKDDVLDNPEQFARVFGAFQATTSEALDQVNDLGSEGNRSLILLRPTVVAITADGGQVHGELCHAKGDGTLEPVPKTRLPRN